MTKVFSTSETPEMGALDGIDPESDGLASPRDGRFRPNQLEDSGRSDWSRAAVVPRCVRVTSPQSGLHGRGQCSGADLHPGENLATTVAGILDAITDDPPANPVSVCRDGFRSEF